MYGHKFQVKHPSFSFHFSFSFVS